MINLRSSFYLGVFVLMIPFLGFPTFWKMGLVIFAGVILILSSVRVPIPKRIKTPVKKEKPESVPEVFKQENSVPELMPQVAKVSVAPAVLPKVEESVPLKQISHPTPIQIISITPNSKKTPTRSKAIVKISTVKKRGVKQL